MRNAAINYLLYIPACGFSAFYKWANRFTSVNKKRKGMLTIPKIHPDTPIDPKKKTNKETPAVTADGKITSNSVHSTLGA